MPWICGRGKKDFYPRSPCGERLVSILLIAIGVVFLSTLSLRRATIYEIEGVWRTAISIHALLAESDRIMLYIYEGLDISIHALLAESDGFGLLQIRTYQTFLSTLSLRRATFSIGSINKHNVFLSTLSLRRATSTQQFLLFLLRNFYPRSPCGERLMKILLPLRHSNFYPRSPCGERLGSGNIPNQQRSFLSTLSLRRATEKLH